MYKQIAAMLTATLILAASVFFAVSSIIRDEHQQARTACIAEHKDTQTLSNLLTFFQARTLENPNLTAQQKDQVNAFYAAAQKQLPDTTRPC